MVTSGAREVGAAEHTGQSGKLGQLHFSCADFCLIRKQQNNLCFHIVPP
jgi:hypothetical protein